MDEDQKQSNQEMAWMIIEKAKKFLETAHPPQKDLIPNEYVLFTFEHDNRQTFDYFAPSSQSNRGLPLMFMNPKQKKAVIDLIQASLSEEGFKKVKQIFMLEYVLKRRESDKPFYIRIPNLYYISFFGIPSVQGAWSWRIQGHHLSLQWLFLDGKIISSTPQFIGTQPAKIKEDDVISKETNWVDKYNILIENDDLLFEELPLGTRVMANEEDSARELIESLTVDQQKKARIKVPWDLDSTNVRNAFTDRKPNRLEDSGKGVRGILYIDLTEDQKLKLKGLILAQTKVQHPLIAQERMERIGKAGWDDIRFLFMNGYERGDELAYKIRSETFVVEYNNDAFTLADVPLLDVPGDHQHSVWRDLTDFGDTYSLIVK